VRSHLGRLSRSAVAKLLKLYDDLGPIANDIELLRTVRKVLNDGELGTLFYRDLVEASLDYDPDGMG
jgi:hypothetical protein